jgi:carboxyl-terminal processing protease
MNFVKKHFIKIFIIVTLSGVFVAADTSKNQYFEISKNLDVFATLYKELNTYYGQMQKTW